MLHMLYMMAHTQVRINLMRTTEAYGLAHATEHMLIACCYYQPLWINKMLPLGKVGGPRTLCSYGNLL